MKILVKAIAISILAIIALIGCSGPSSCDQHIAGLYSDQQIYVVRGHNESTYLVGLGKSKIITCPYRTFSPHLQIREIRQLESSKE